MIDFAQLLLYRATTGLYINQGTVTQFVRLNGELKASLWLYLHWTAGIALLELVFSHFQLRRSTRMRPASWCALEWDSAPLSTCRSGDYIQGFRRGKEDVIWNCCVLLLCTFLNAVLSCSVHWYCMTAARGSSSVETIFVSADECCNMFCFFLISLVLFRATADVSGVHLALHNCVYVCVLPNSMKYLQTWQDYIKWSTLAHICALSSITFSCV